MTTNLAGASPVDLGLGPLPERLGVVVSDSEPVSFTDCVVVAPPIYTQSELDAAVAAERERCAKVADEHAKRSFPWGSENADIYHAQADWAAAIAKAIRQLRA